MDRERYVRADRAVRLVTGQIDRDPQQIKAALRDEFPGWSFIHTNRLRWWAVRNVQRDESGRRFKPSPSDFDADTPDQLRAALHEAGEGS